MEIPGENSRCSIRLRSQGQYRLKSIQLTKKISAGGEGTVFGTDDPELVAKVFDAPNPTRSAKLRFMVDNPPRQEHNDHHAIAWPVGVLIYRNCEVGFVMPTIRDAKDLSFAIFLRSRKIHFAHFNFKAYVLAARNLSAAIEEIHAKEYVIIDVKAENVLITMDAKVTIIDTDSIQVNCPPTIYYGSVHTPGYRSPEMIRHSIDPRKTLIKESHDLFCLGVIIHELLFGGLHPFFGGEDVDDEIRDRNYIHRLSEISNSLKRKQAEANLNSRPGMNTMPVQLRDLFTRCFIAGDKKPDDRPRAKQWKDALDKFARELQQCPHNKSHFYHKTNRRCPWCMLEQRARKSSSTRKRTPTRKKPSVQVPFKPASVQPPQQKAPPFSSSFSTISAQKPRRTVSQNSRKWVIGSILALGLILGAYFVLPGLWGTTQSIVKSVKENSKARREEARKKLPIWENFPWRNTHSLFEFESEPAYRVDEQDASDELPEDPDSRVPFPDDLKVLVPESAYAGEIIEAELTAGHGKTSKGALNQFRVLIEIGTQSIYQDFGTFSPPASVTRKVRIKIHPHHVGGIEKISFVSSEANSYAPPALEKELAVKALPRPDFVLKCDISDVNSDFVVGNGNGKLEKGEAVGLTLTATNNTNRLIEGGTFIISQFQSKSIDLDSKTYSHDRTVEFPTGDLEPGKEVKVTHTLSLPPQACPNELLLELAFVDSSGRYFAAVPKKLTVTERVD